MNILVFPAPEGDVIAHEEQFGQFEGEFCLRGGAVHYRHPSAPREIFVNHDIATFRKCVEVWNRYRKRVLQEQDEREQERVVEALRRELGELSVLSEEDDTFWCLLLEQAESGSL